MRKKYVETARYVNLERKKERDRMYHGHWLIFNQGQKVKSWKGVKRKIILFILLCVQNLEIRFT